MSDAEQRTVFKPNPVQQSFIESRAKADLFSSRMGEGKSTALAWAAFYHTRHNPGARWALIRDTFENIKGTTQKTFFDWFPPGVYGTYHGGNKTFTWASGLGGGEVLFMGMDDANDATKLMSRELAGFGMDEPAPALGNVGINAFIFEMAMTRLRQPGMKWYAAKLAENNPDEAHWTYNKFVSPGSDGFVLWQPRLPENILHLPKDYYANLRATWKHRPDLIRRFVDGEFGFQAVGKNVTPQWNDKFHLAVGLAAEDRNELICCWDFGHTPVCIITQITAAGHWDILQAHCGVDMGAEELIVDMVRPALLDLKRRHNVTWRHIGDPAGKIRSQDSINRSPVRTIRTSLGGNWTSGPVPLQERLDPLQAVLTKSIGGRGKVRVDRELAAPVWFSLRGGWHYHVANNGLISGVPVKNHPESDVGDALGYGAAILFPMGKLQGSPGFRALGGEAGYFGDQVVVRQSAAEDPERAKYLAQVKAGQGPALVVGRETVSLPG